MIPEANITEWSLTAPWAEPRQVEQDLIVSRTLVDPLHPLPPLALVWPSPSSATERQSMLKKQKFLAFQIVSCRARWYCCYAKGAILLLTQIKWNYARHCRSIAEYPMRNNFARLISQRTRRKHG